MSAALQAPADAVPALTADLCARGVMAAAMALQVNPLAVMQAPPRSRLLTARIATASALALAGICPAPNAAKSMSIPVQSIYGARGKAARPGGQGGLSPEAAAAFLAAQEAARRALVYARWRPEAAASVVAGDGSDAVASPSAQPPAEPPTPALAPRPEIATPERRAMPGRISAMVQPGRSPVSVPVCDRPLADRITEVLRDGSACATGLASILGAKEILVSQSLAGLAHQGLIAAGDVPAEGARHRRWRLAERTAA